MAAHCSRRLAAVCLLGKSASMCIVTLIMGLGCTLCCVRPWVLLSCQVLLYGSQLIESSMTTDASQNHVWLVAQCGSASSVVLLPRFFFRCSSCQRTKYLFCTWYIALIHIHVQEWVSCVSLPCPTSSLRHLFFVPTKTHITMVTQQYFEQILFDSKVAPQQVTAIAGVEVRGTRFR
ncbi:unnamed protein product, partial [Discosporangium mesarthrocarpum]